MGNDCEPYELTIYVLYHSIDNSLSLGSAEVTVLKHGQPHARPTD